MNTSSVRILLLSSSRSTPSHTRTTLQHLAHLLRERGAIAYAWDLYRTPLPGLHSLNHDHSQPQDNETLNAQRLTESIGYADAMVWSTPTLHGSYSGMLKNALDNLQPAFCWQKPVGLICHGRKRTGGRACDQLRIVAQGLLATVLPTQIMTIDEDFLVERDRYVLTSAYIQQLLIRMADELMAYSVFLRLLRTHTSSL